MSLIEKLKWSLGILMVFVLILSTNLLDKNNFLRVRDSIVAIYEDRLVANDVIYDMAEIVGEKELAIATENMNFLEKENSRLNMELDELMSRYESTRLTDSEAKEFSQLKENMSRLMQIEQVNDSAKEPALRLIDELQLNLHRLSKIQLSEGRRQKLIGKSAVESVELFTRIEIYLLVVMAIVIQIIVMYNPSSKQD